MSRTEHVLTEAEKERMERFKHLHAAPTWDHRPSGKLVLTIDYLNCHNQTVNQVTWTDSEKKRIEDRLDSVCDLLAEVAKDLKRRRALWEERERTMRGEERRRQEAARLVVVGSSRGGAVAMNLNSGNARLVLLCPVWKKHGTASTVKADTVILHSRADDVVPFADSEERVRNSGLPFWTLIEVGNDHRLAAPESLETLLEACLHEEDDVEPVEGDEDEDILERD